MPNSNQLGLILISSLLLIPLASATYTTVFPKEILFFDRLIANNEQTKIISNEDILFTSIGITTNQDVTRARITVQAMPDCPENAPYQANVLQCFFVSSNFDEDMITNMDITFKVLKSWMRANGLDSIELRRYSYSWNNNMQGKLSQWRPLQTTKIGEDNDFSMYTSLSDGIDYFSIVGIKTVTQPKSNQITAQAVQIPKQEQPKQVIVQINTTKPNYSWMFVVIAAITATMISFIPNITKKQSSEFRQLTNYIKTSKESEDYIKNSLRKAGWEDWQIGLAFNESKKK